MKKSLLFLTVVLFTNFAHSQVTNGLKAEYLFNNGNANADFGGANGTVNGATLTSDRFGNSNKAYYFDGVNDYIDFGSGNPFYMSVGDFSISLWVQYSESQNGYVYYKEASDEGYSLIVTGTNTPNQPSTFTGNILYSKTKSANSLRRVDGGGPLDSSWHHVTVVTDYTDSTSVWVDGVFIRSDNNYFSGTINAIGAPFTIGAAIFNGVGLPSYYFKGKIDDIKIYNRVLTANEITLLKNDGNPTVGLNDIQLPKNTLRVYPNPASNLLNIEVTESTPLTILNVLGETVKQQTIQGLGSIDVSELSPGIYYIQSTKGVNAKFIKE